MRRWVLEAAIYYVKGGSPFISAVKLNQIQNSELAYFPKLDYVLRGAQVHLVSNQPCGVTLQTCRVNKPCRPDKKIHCVF